MFESFRKTVKESAIIQSSTREHKLTWHEPGDDNPFNKRVLDIRGFTQTSLFVTRSRFVAEIFTERRKSNGQELVAAKMYNKETIDANINYQHHRPLIDGVLYNAKCMEDKWDVYAWNDIIYFTRSWTGEVVYKAFIRKAERGFAVYKIDYIPENYNNHNQALVINIVHFLIKTLIFGSIYPNKVPSFLKTDTEIAIYSFSQFGHNCWYATFDDILDTVTKMNIANV